MQAFLLFSVMLILLAALTATGWGASKPDRGILLGVSIPYSHMKEQAVLEILTRYRKALLMAAAGFLLLAVPILLVQKPFSLLFALLFLWVIVYMTVFDRILGRYEKQLRALKKERGWTAGTQRILSVDTEVARIKSKMPVSWLWMLPSLAISCLPLVSALFQQRSWPYLMIAVLSLLLHGMFWLCRRFSIRGRSTVYSQKTSVNRACHYLSIRLWTLNWTVQAAISSVCMTVSYFCALGGPPERFWFPILMILFMASVLLGTYFTYVQVRDRRNRLLEMEGGPVTADEDEFWKRGWYNNPYDPRVTVEKRFGIGWTINLGTIKGKLYAYGSLAFVAGLLLFLLVLFIRVDVIPFTLAVEENRVSISAGMYKEDFSLEEVRGIELIDTVPDGTRINGAATDSYLLGHFRMDGYGDSLLYVYPDSLPCLVISLPERTVFFTARNPEETVQAYEKLKNQIQ